MLRKSMIAAGAAIVFAAFALVWNAAPAVAKDKIIYASTTTLQGDLPIYVAMNKGFFKDAGIDFTIKILGGSKTRDSIAAGDANFGLLHVAVVWIAHQKGLKIKFISMYYTKGLFGILVHNKHKDKVKTLQDLKGLRVMTFIPGAAAPSALSYYFARAGIDEKRDVKMTYVSSVDPRVWYNALESGKVDVLGALWDPGFSLALKRGTMYALLDHRDKAQHDKWIGGDVNTLGTVVHARTIKENPALVRKMVEVVDRALGYIQQASIAELVEVTQEAGILRGSKEDLAVMIRGAKPNFTKSGAPSVSNYNRAVEMYMKGGFLKKNVSFDEIVDSSFAGKSE